MRVVTTGIKYGLYSPSIACFFTGRGWEGEAKEASLYPKRSYAERVIGQIKGEIPKQTPKPGKTPKPNGKKPRTVTHPSDIVIVTVSVSAYGVDDETGEVEGTSPAARANEQLKVTA